jgi:hypothetical protein
MLCHLPYSMYKMKWGAGVPAVPGGGVGVPGEGVLHHRLLLLPAPPALQDQREEMLAGPSFLLPAPQNKLPEKSAKNVISNLRLFRHTEEAQFAFLPQPLYLLVFLGSKLWLGFRRWRHH